MPKLTRVVLDGASRHRVLKGFLLWSPHGQQVDELTRGRVIARTEELLASKPEASNVRAKASPEYPAVLHLQTPFLPVHTPDGRDQFVRVLQGATAMLLRSATEAGVRAIATGIDAMFADDGDRPTALCDDVHEIEVHDEGEIERVFNLFRQYLPEFLAISANSSVHGGKPQKDFSLRMRSNQRTFLPRYISQFNARHLGKLERIMRRDYGLADLRQMDVNPLAGDYSSLVEKSGSPVRSNPAAVALRFIDAQFSYAFLRAQLLIFQAVAMTGRALARQGRRVFPLESRNIDENRALAIQSGASAVFRADAAFAEKRKRRGEWYHDKNEPERATSSLLSLLEGPLLPALRDLACTPGELEPITLGAVLRRSGKKCLANYAEYQQYLYYTQGARFTAALQEHSEHLMTTPNADFLVDYNRRTYPDEAAAAELEWSRRLMPEPRITGVVKWFDPEKGVGLIEGREARTFLVQYEDLEGVELLRPRQEVTFESQLRGKREFAARVRLVVRTPPVRPPAPPRPPQTINRPRIEPEPSSGRVKWFDAVKGFGVIKGMDGREYFTIKAELSGAESLKPGQPVTFYPAGNLEKPKAVRVRPAPKPDPRPAPEDKKDAPPEPQQENE